MKQTAVEWLYDELKKLIKESELTDMKPSEFDSRESKLINQAKELEKQQQGYSEEEVIDSIKYTIDNFFNGKLAGLNSNEIFEQVKKK